MDTSSSTPIPFSDFPEGTVTFLFTDIEGSTRLLEQLREGYATLLSDHRRILRQAFAAWQGREVDTQGDAFFVAFSRVTQAVCAAAQAQRALAEHAWPQGVTVRVRMGIHTGEPWSGAEGYVGMDVHRAARIAHVAHGGQVLVSNAAAGLLRGHLPDGAALIDLGLQQFKGLSDPERVYQLTHPGLETDFPALQSSLSNPHNLPTQLTSFIGRAMELQEVKRLLESNRLLTLLGPGGTGKTRLMLQAASELVEQFPDGVWLVELAPHTNPELVVEKTAEVLGVSGQADRPLVDALAVYLRHKETLLLLDNTEHLILASAELAEHLLGACPQVKILVTSREVLSINGETTFQVPSLSLPAVNVARAAELETAEAAQLFLERARAVQPDFKLSAGNIPAVAEIVRRLDGIPLALELAAARLKVMPTEGIAARLNDRFRLLVSGRRTALPRQQTLQALIDWSWNLLDESEQVLLRRLSVFSGGWILEDAQQVAGDAPLDEFSVLDNLEALVNKSLVATSSLADGSGRFHLLESIHQYAQARLSEAGEDETIGKRHAAYFAGLVRDAEAADTQVETLAWIKRLVRETDNFRAAFNWMEKHDPRQFLESAGKLILLDGQGFWSFSQPQARRWLERAIEIGRTAEAPEEMVQKHQLHLGLALGAMSSINFFLGRHEEGATAGAEALSILRPLGEARYLAFVIGIYAYNLNYLGRWSEAFEAGQEAREVARAQKDWVALSIALVVLGLSTLMSGDIEKVYEYLRAGKAVIQELGSSWVGLTILMMEGRLFTITGDLDRAESIYREADLGFQEVGEPAQTNITRSELAHTLRRQGKWEQALPLYRETILYFRDRGHEPAVANQLECFAYIAIAQEEPEKAGRLLGAAQAIRERRHNPIHLPWETADYEQAMKQLGEMLGGAGRDAAIDEGRSMTLDEAVSFARTGPAG
jgi:predicted ATPase/class 3 adenylate cyclase